MTAPADTDFETLIATHPHRLAAAAARRILAGLAARPMTGGELSWHALNSSIQGAFPADARDELLELLAEMGLAYSFPAVAPTGRALVVWDLTDAGRAEAGRPLASVPAAAEPYRAWHEGEGGFGSEHECPVEELPPEVVAERDRRLSAAKRERAPESALRDSAGRPPSNKSAREGRSRTRWDSLPPAAASRLILDCLRRGDAAPLLSEDVGGRLRRAEEVIVVRKWDET